MGHAGRSELALGRGHGCRHSASCCGAPHGDMGRCRCGGRPLGRVPCVTRRNEVRCAARRDVVVLPSGRGAGPGRASPQGVSRRREALPAWAASFGTARTWTPVRRGAAQDELGRSGHPFGGGQRGRAFGHEDLPWPERIPLRRASRKRRAHRCGARFLGTIARSIRRLGAEEIDRTQLGQTSLHGRLDDGRVAGDRDDTRCIFKTEHNSIWTVGGPDSQCPCSQGCR